MLKLLTKTSFIACLYFSSQAQPEYIADYLGLANSGICYASPFATGLNPALISAKFSLGFNYNNNFLLKDLSYSILETQYKHLGFRYGYTGNHLYRQQNISVGYGTNLTNQLKAGVALQTIRTDILESTPEINTYYLLGLYYENQNLKLAATWNSDLTHKDIRFRYGFQYSFTDIFHVLAEYQHQKNSSNWALGLRYQAHSSLQITSGLNLQQGTIHFGLQYKYNKTQINVGFSLGHTLGPQSASSIAFVSK